MLQEVEMDLTNISRDYHEKHVSLIMSTTLSIVSSAIAQSLNAFLVSQRLYQPTYSEHGLVAAIAAHATWNTFIYIMWVQLLLCSRANIAK